MLLGFHLYTFHKNKMHEPEKFLIWKLFAGVDFVS